MADEIIARYDEIVACSDIDEARALYYSRGVDEGRFLDSLMHDWDIELGRIREEASSNPPEYRIPSLEVKVGTATCSIFGIVHPASLYRALDLSPKFSEQLSRTISERKNWISEQMINRISADKIVEMPNYAASSSGDNVEQGVLDGVKSPLILLLVILRSFQTGQQKESLEDRFLNLPLESWSTGSLPNHLALSLRIKEERKLSIYQQQSIYMGEFMKAFMPGEDRNAIVGAAHATEMRYALTHEFNGRPADLARHHAERLASDPDKYNAALSKAFRDFGTSYGVGMAIGISPYFLIPLQVALGIIYALK